MAISLSNFLASKKVTYATKGMAVAVFATTALKATGRPAFIMADKKSDSETKKYTAAKEFLYQMLCLGMTFAMVIPAQMLGFKLAKKHLDKVPELTGKIKNLKTFEKVTKDLDELTKEAKEILKIDQLNKESKDGLKMTKGGVELGSFVGSILGLTIIAPLISHKILHPIMHKLGMDKKEAKNPTLEKLEQPILTEGHHKVDKKA